MGAAKRKPHPALIERLLREPAAFEFFQAVHLLEQHLAAQPRASKPVGHDYPSAEVGLRFRASASLAFPTRNLGSVRKCDTSSEPGPEYELGLTFLGLVGPAGTLPRHYTEALLQRLHFKDSALLDFLDLFEHRTAAFFFRAWKKHRLPVAYAGTDRGRGVADPILTSLLGFVGLEPRPRGRAIDAALLSQAHHAGLFSDRRRSAEGLRGMLAGLFGCRVRVDQFVGEWVDLDVDARGRLGGRGPGSQARLGDETVLGARVWSVEARVRVVAGPMDRARFRELWPGSPRLRFLHELVRAYVGPLIECDFVWELAPDAPATLQLGGDQQLGRDCWLGWTDVLRSDRRVPSPPLAETAPKADPMRA